MRAVKSNADASTPVRGRRPALAGLTNAGAGLALGFASVVGTSGAAVVGIAVVVGVTDGGSVAVVGATVGAAVVGVAVGVAVVGAVVGGAVVPGVVGAGAGVVGRAGATATDTAITRVVVVQPPALSQTWI